MFEFKQMELQQSNQEIQDLVNWWFYRLNQHNYSLLSKIELSGFMKSHLKPIGQALLMAVNEEELESIGSVIVNFHTPENNNLKKQFNIILKKCNYDNNQYIRIYVAFRFGVDLYSDDYKYGINLELSQLPLTTQTVESLIIYQIEPMITRFIARHNDFFSKNFRYNSRLIA